MNWFLAWLTLSLSIGMGIGIIVAIALVLLTHPQLPRSERIGLGLLASGILWGGVSRLMGTSLSLGDVLLLAGMAILLWRFFFHNPKIGVLS